MTVSHRATPATNKLKPSKLLQLNVILLITFSLNLFFTLAMIDISKAFSRWMPPALWNLVIGLSIIAMIAEGLVLVLSWTPFQKKIVDFIKNAANKLSRLRALNLLIIALLITLHGFFVFGPIGQHTRSLPTFIFSFWIITLLNGLLLKAWNQNETNTIQLSWIDAILAASLLSAFGHVLAAAISRITSYPFTRYWSETSRYYYASLFFSERFFGIKIPLPALHPSEYLTLTVPYLIPGSPIWFHRAWQHFLIITMPLITAIILSRRLAVNGIRRLLLIVWVFLYLGVGPVYYHLLVPVIIVLWGYETNSKRPTWSRLLKSFLVIGVASIWAGISRVNWFPVPGLLAASLYLLETPLTNKSPGKPQHRSWLTYLIEPVVWVVLGTVIAAISYAVYILISGNPLDYFATTYTSDLLWYRLLPNPTFPPGILTGILIVSLPLFILLIGKLIQKFKTYGYVVAGEFRTCAGLEIHQ